MEAKTKDLWVFVETSEDGAAKNVGIELLTPGRLLADKQGGALAAVVIGCGADKAVETASAHGADKVIVVDGPEYRHYTTDAYAAALCALVEKYGPTSMLIGATNNGRDLGPRVSCRLHTGLTADCTGRRGERERGLDPPRFRRQPDGHHPVPGSPAPDWHRPPRRVQEGRSGAGQGRGHPGGHPCAWGQNSNPGD